jgi:hypothetical protein
MVNMDVGFPWVSLDAGFGTVASGPRGGKGRGSRRNKTWQWTVIARAAGEDCGFDPNPKQIGRNDFIWE